MLKILLQLQKLEKKTYLLLPNHQWYVGTIQYVDEEVCILTPDVNENDGEYYQFVARLDAILAIEYGVDPRGNSMTLAHPDFDEVMEDDSWEDDL